MDSRQARWMVEELLAAYADCIDNDRLEEWPGFFTENCLYKIIPWENVSYNLALGWVLCESRGMLQDRVVAHRTANLYAPHRYRHIVGSVRVLSCDDGAIEARANYLVVRTALDAVRYGTSEIYSAGEYQDRVIIENNQARFAEKIVVSDTARVDTLLVTPI
ncbi:MAG TPA: aromatic-ring-hydroxylating dioxygenase subunit beta [Candidatus Cybelea sp.]